MSNSTPAAVYVAACMLRLGDVVLARHETTRGGTVLSTPGGTVVGIDLDQPYSVVVVLLEQADGTETRAPMAINLGVEAIRAA